MEKQNTAIRLKEIMNERNLRQVDILNLTEPYCHKYNVKMNKSDISQYCSGKTEPNQDKLFVLGKALNVSEAWLMGYDVPKAKLEPQSSYIDKEILNTIDFLDVIKGTNEYVVTIEIIKLLNYLNLNGLQKVYDYAYDLLETKNYGTVSDLFNFGKLKQQHEKEEREYLSAKAARSRTDIEVTGEMIKHDDEIMDDENF